MKYVTSFSSSYCVESCEYGVLIICITSDFTLGLGYNCQVMHRDKLYWSLNSRKTESLCNYNDSDSCFVRHYSKYSLQEHMVTKFKLAQHTVSKCVYCKKDVSLKVRSESAGLTDVWIQPTPQSDK